jgi:peptide-methionine (S)-S-oxide reductase
VKLFPFALAAVFAAASAGTSSGEAAGRRAQATFAGGCFWCTEYDFDKIPGVVSTTSGFIGGRVKNPTYEQVSAGGTGHYEAVRVVFDPDKVSYATLARRFFRTIDPTDAGGQFCDRGEEYRTALFVADEGQRSAAAAAKSEAERVLKKRVATQILPAGAFYPAEAKHQDYHRKNPIKYRYYRYTCGRDARVKEVWGG